MTQAIKGCWTSCSKPIEQLYREKPLNFAIVIILALGCCLMMGLGVALSLQKTPSLCFDPRALTLAGLSGTVLFIGGGIISLVKKPKEQAPPPEINKSTKEEHPEKKEETTNTEQTEETTYVASSTPYDDTASIPSVLSPQAWGQLNVKIFGEVPKQPSIDWESEDPHIPGMPLSKSSILIFCPGRVIYKGQKFVLGPDTLKEVIDTYRENSASTLPGLKYSFSDPDIKTIESPFTPGPKWFLIKRHAIPGSVGRSYEEQKSAVAAEEDYRLPTYFEATLASLLVYRLTGKSLYQGAPNSTRCLEVQTMHDQQSGEAFEFPIVVGGYGPNGVDIHAENPDELNGVGAVREYL